MNRKAIATLLAAGCLAMGTAVVAQPETAKQPARAPERPPAVAQEGAKQPQVTTSDPALAKMMAEQRRQQVERRMAEEGAVVSVAFPGGTVAKYVTALRSAAAPNPANIAVSEEAAAVQMPAVELKSVPLYTALKVIESAAPQMENRQWQVRAVGQGNGLEEGMTSPAFTVSIWRVGPIPGAAGPGPQSQLRVLAMRDLLGEGPGAVKVETALTAVETALKMIPNAEGSYEIKFHADSGLLFVRGMSQHVDGATSVLMQLRDSRRAEQRASADSAKHAAERRAQVVELESKRNILVAQLDAAVASLERAEQMRASGNVPEEEVRKCQLDVVERQEQLKAIEARMAAVSQDDGPGDGPDIESMQRKIQELAKENADLRSKVEALSKSKGGR